MRERERERYYPLPTLRFPDPDIPIWVCLRSGFLGSNRFLGGTKGERRGIYGILARKFRISGVSLVALSPVWTLAGGSYPGLDSGRCARAKPGGRNVVFHRGKVLAKAVVLGR
jgi:hypothetical protein